jgi:hypothetical protein
MKRFGWIALSVLVLGGVAMTLPSCGKNLQCGAGTVEMNGQCVQAGATVQSCGDGGVVIGGNCYPVICGANTKFNPATGLCEGTGGGMTNGCASSCSAPGASTFCITGTAKYFIPGHATMNNVVEPTATSNAVVRVYDPIAFVTNPNTPPAAVVNIEDNGCFIADGVPRFSSGLVAVAIDDMAHPGTDLTYAQMGAGAILHAGQNVTSQIAYALLNTEADTWQTSIGATNPPGCSGGLAGCGAWIGAYYEKTSTDSNPKPIAGVKPSRPGDDPATGNVFCFPAGDLAHLDPNQKTTTSTGMCVISPDVVEPHGGVCGTSGCTCNGTACTPTFTASTGGTAPGVFFYQPFFSTM